MSSKENYHEWFHKVKNTLNFNGMWDGIFENENFGDKKYGDAVDDVDKIAPVALTNTKELALWKNKDKKA